MESNVSVSTFQKILKLVEYESARRKSMLKKKQGKERNKSSHSLFSYLFLSRKLKKALGNSFEPIGLKGNQRNSRELI